MSRVPLTRLASVCVALWFSLFAAPLPAIAHESADANTPNHSKVGFSARCHAATDQQTSLADMVAARRQPDGAPGNPWICRPIDWQAQQEAGWLLFEREAWQAQGERLPRYFFSRIGRHQTITFAALDADGTIRTRKWNEADGVPVPKGPMFRLDLPELTPTSEAVIVRIERPHSVMLLTDARLALHADDAGWTGHEIIVISFVLGMLVLPLFFDINFFIVLRERFILLHAAMLLAMMGAIVTDSGLIAFVPFFSVHAIAVTGHILWAVGIGLSALFLVDFLEPGALSKTMQNAALAVGVWTIFVPGVFALQPHFTHGFDDYGYLYSLTPIMPVALIALAQAILRGSRSARFVAIAWTPFTLACIDSLLRSLGVYLAPSSFDLSMYVAIAFEVIVISLAIADRFFAIRRERDEALTEARTLEKLSERDALTGLLNRRGLETRFKDLFRSGFDTFALIDLDRFKRVNDRHGHQVGDAALIACARALESHQDADLVAARLGGEEFVVLLRGAHSLQRAEAARQAIPLRIAVDVEGLEELVTASSGAVEVPRATRAMMSFDEFYARADSLMYDAKAAGRNRMVSERLTLFASPVSTRGSDSAPNQSGNANAVA